MCLDIGYGDFCGKFKVGYWSFLFEDWNIFEFWEWEDVLSVINYFGLVRLKWGYRYEVLVIDIYIVMEFLMKIVRFKEVIFVICEIKGDFLFIGRKIYVWVLSWYYC